MTNKPPVLCDRCKTQPATVADYVRHPPAWLCFACHRKDSRK